MNKLFKIAILTGVITLGVSSFSMAKFVDVAENSYYFNAISYLAENKIINGYPDNTFRTDGKVTRAEFSKMISIAEELILDFENQKSFNDIGNHWSKEYVELAASNNLLKGYEDNTFKPNKQITYGEVATILLRTLNIYEVANENMNWPDDCMNYASEIGLFNGVATNDLLGMNPARRDNVALMIYNKIKLEELIESDGNENVSGDKVNSEIISGDTTDPEKDNKENPETDNVEADDNNDKVTNFEPEKIYIGTVKEIKKRRGENYITIDNFENSELEIKLSSKVDIPELNTLIIYKITEDAKIKLKKELPLKDINLDYMFVEDADEELIKIKDTKEILDLDKKEYKYSGKTYKLNKFTYYLAEMVENEDNIYVFDNVVEVPKSELNIKDKDRLIFDSKSKIAFIIRGIEQ